MKYCLFISGIDEKLYYRLPKGVKIINLYQNESELLNKRSIVNVDMNEYGFGDENGFNLIRKYAFERDMKALIEDKIIMMYLKDINHIDGFVNNTNEYYLMSHYMHKRRLKNYYLYIMPSLIDGNEAIHSAELKTEKLVDYGNVVPIVLAGNIFSYDKQVKEEQKSISVANAVRNIVGDYLLDNYKHAHMINKEMSRRFKKGGFICTFDNK